MRSKGVFAAWLYAVACLSMPGLAADHPAGIASRLPTALVDWAETALERRDIERDVSTGAERGFSRQDILAAAGRASAAAGDFRRSGVAYVMFLKEFGLNHPHGTSVAERLIESLAPLRIDSVSIELTRDGPKYRPSWKLDASPTNGDLQLAVSACDYLGDFTRDQLVAAQAQYKKGRILRAMSDWAASTAAWDRCAELASGTELEPEALWHSADNLDWAGSYAEAGAHLDKLLSIPSATSLYPAARRKLVAVRLAAARPADWHDDPAAQFVAERVALRGSLTAMEHYQMMADSLRRQESREGLVALVRWAGKQSDWSALERAIICQGAVDALLSSGAPTREQREEAQALLSTVPQSDLELVWAVAIADRRARLLIELGRSDEAIVSLAPLQDRCSTTPQLLAAIVRTNVTALLTLRRPSEARAAWQELCRLIPEDQGMAELDKAITAQEGR